MTDRLRIALAQLNPTVGAIAQNLALAKEALASREPVEYRNGVPLFPKRLDGQIVTLELVNRLRDEE